jgi:exodeoxyribonuclease III
MMKIGINFDFSSKFDTISVNLYQISGGDEMKTLRILSWNVNGIRAVHNKNALESIFETRPDIICLQETKAAEDQLDSPIREKPGYTSFFSSAEKKGYSGVAIYTMIQPANIQKGFGINRFDSEGRILIADYQDFVLFNIYYPNGKQSAERLAYKMEFYDAFLEYADRLKNQGRNLVICGDVNTAHKEIDLARPKENEKVSGFLPEERAWMDKFIEHGYIDTFRVFNQEGGQYTWWDQKSRARDRNIGWRIDYFYVNDGFKEHIKAAFILPEVMGSDHCPIGLDLVLP